MRVRGGAIGSGRGGFEPGQRGGGRQPRPALGRRRAKRIGMGIDAGRKIEPGLRRPGKGFSRKGEIAAMGFAGDGWVEGGLRRAIRARGHLRRALGWILI